MISRILSLGIMGLLGCSAVAVSEVVDEPATYIGSGYIVADTRGKERRDDRGDNRDDRRDCRQDEGRVGDDKRDCKQEQRGDNEGDA